MRTLTFCFKSEACKGLLSTLAQRGGLGANLLSRKLVFPWCAAVPGEVEDIVLGLFFSLSWFPMESFSSLQSTEQVLSAMVPLGTHQGGAP